jgi:hypothetical protein
MTSGKLRKMFTITTTHPTSTVMDAAVTITIMTTMRPCQLGPAINA